MNVLQSHMQANLYGMGRDPTYFPEPQRYLPDRWVRDAEDDDDELGKKQQLIVGLIFGHGARMCIGQYKAYYCSHYANNVYIMSRI